MVRVVSHHVLAEFGPVFAFFVAGQFFSFFTATAILIVTTSIAFCVSWRRDRRIPVMPFISGLFVVIAGIITLLYRAPDALILSDSLYYFAIAGIIGAGYIFKKFVLKLFFDCLFAMSNEGWHTLSLRWFYLCILAGVLNEIVRWNMSPEFWIDYKFAKLIVITLFGFYQFTVARRYRIPEESNEWGVRKNLFKNRLKMDTREKLRKIHV